VLPKGFEGSLLYYSMLPDIGKLTALLEVHRFHQLILLIRDLILPGELLNPGLRPKMRTTIHTLHKYSTLPSRRTQCASIKNNNRRMLFKGTNDVYCENHTNKQTRQSDKMQSFYCETWRNTHQPLGFVKPDSTYANHQYLRG